MISFLIIFSFIFGRLKEEKYIKVRSSLINMTVLSECLMTVSVLGQQTLVRDLELAPPPERSLLS